MNHRYGWLHELSDERDYRYSVYRYAEATAPLPSSVDLRPKCPPVYDQNGWGSCVAQATAGALEFDRMGQRLVDFTPSRMFVYYNGRAMEGTTKTDGGMYVRDAMKVAATLGAPPETIWTQTQAHLLKKPSAKAYAEALKHQALQYLKLDNTQVDQLRACLAAGFPFVFGATLYASFESAAAQKTGIVPMPKSKEQVLGGHAQLAVGYNDATGRFLVRNSWGTGWALAGYEWMPYDYLTSTKLCDDFWTIRKVE